MARGRIIVSVEQCKGCQLCVPVCPFNLIELGTNYNAKGYRPATLVDPEHRCTGCMLCAMMCPDAVITVYREVKVKSVANRISTRGPGLAKVKPPANVQPSVER